ncbi:MAG TPA: Rv3235 family protein [Mycobacterium sp.]
MAPTPLVSPVVDYEPPPVGMSVCRSTPVLRRRVPRPGHPYHAGLHHVRDADPPRAAVAFADAALRRVLEVIDRRRPVAQLRPLLAPALIDTVIGLSRSSHNGAGRMTSTRTVAKLRRMRLRMVDGAEGLAAEVFGTYTTGARVRAFAARIELNGDRWRIVALQIG